MIEMVVKQKNSKISLATPQIKAPFICQPNLENVVRMTSIFFKERIYSSLVHIYTIGFQENKVYVAT